jgi:chromosome segregation ATPase
LKEILTRLIALFGLVPARRYKNLVRQTEELRAGATTWKQRAVEAAAHAKSLEKEVGRQARRTKETRSALERLRHREADLQKLQDQLSSTERELTLAREHLMAVEVKLDILEGAANVLDIRTRAAVAQPSRPSGVPV